MAAIVGSRSELASLALLPGALVLAPRTPAAQRAFKAWEKFTRLTTRFFPPTRILHPLPCHCIDARTRGRSPVR